MSIESMQFRPYRSFKVDNEMPTVLRNATGRYRCTSGCAVRATARRSPWNSSGSAGALCIGGWRRSRPDRAASAGGRTNRRTQKPVLDTRRAYPFMGTVRIQGMLPRKGVHLSVSTVAGFSSGRSPRHTATYSIVWGPVSARSSHRVALNPMHIGASGQRRLRSHTQDPEQQR